MHRLLSFALILAAVAGCGSKKLGVVGATCSASSDCAGELQCVASVCVDPSTAATVSGTKDGEANIDAFEKLADAKTKAAESDVGKLRAACEQYMLQKSECPKTTADLKAAGVVAREQKDPWGTEFAFTCPGAHASVDVTSYGPDRAPGGGDDITTAENGPS